MNPHPPEAAQVAEALRSTIRGVVAADAPLAPFTSYRLGGAAAVLRQARDQSSLSEVLGWVRLYRLGAPEATVLGAGELGMRYRSSRLDASDLVCAARLVLAPAPREEILERMQRYRDHRSATQPAEARNAGSMFKNPAAPAPSAGRLIEESGLKGHRVGGAEVSPKHANFFLAHPGARAQDVYGLLVAVQAAVLERTGVLLAPEVRLVGTFGEPELLASGHGASLP